jgi:hypothetical protein
MIGRIKRWSSLGLCAGSVAVVLVVGMAGCTRPDGFTVADTNKDGSISAAECERYTLEAVFTEADGNGDGKVVFSEWKAANPDADAKKFGVADADRDGAVTPAEAKSHFTREGTLADLFKKLDANGDGGVSREEASAFRKKLEAESGTPVQKLSKVTSEQ